MTFGTPKYDEEGMISNAIVYAHGSLGNFSSMYSTKTNTFLFVFLHWALQAHALHQQQI